MGKRRLYVRLGSFLKWYQKYVTYMSPQELVWISIIAFQPNPMSGAPASHVGTSSHSVFCLWPMKGAAQVLGSLNPGGRPKKSSWLLAFGHLSSSLWGNFGEVNQWIEDLSISSSFCKICLFNKNKSCFSKSESLKNCLKDVFD